VAIGADFLSPPSTTNGIIIECDHGNFVDKKGIAKIYLMATETGSYRPNLPRFGVLPIIAADGAIDPQKWYRVTLP